MSPKSKAPTVILFCRAVGPGGTYLDFKPTKDGLQGIWTNESCPYDGYGVTHDPTTYEASDGHNVSVLSYDQLWEMLQYAVKNGWTKPKVR